MTTAQQDPIYEGLAEVDQYREAKQRALDRLSLAVAEARDEGASVRTLAERYGVTPSSIHTWTQRGRELRSNGRRPWAGGRVAPRSPVRVLPVWLQWLIVGIVVLCLALHVLDLVAV